MDDPRDAGEVGILLSRLREGDATAFDELFPILYDELHAIASRQRRAWQGNETLDTTALLHETYVKLAERECNDWLDRAHFMHAAARAMRHILINYAERSAAEKRGGGRPPATLDRIADILSSGRSGAFEVEVLIALDRALEELGQVDARAAQIVECRVFAGLTIDETGQALGISAATVSRGWTVAQSWLRRYLLRDGGE